MSSNRLNVSGNVTKEINVQMKEVLTETFVICLTELQARFLLQDLHAAMQMFGDYGRALPIHLVQLAKDLQAVGVTR